MAGWYTPSDASQVWANPPASPLLGELLDTAQWQVEQRLDAIGVARPAANQVPPNLRQAQIQQARAIKLSIETNRDDDTIGYGDLATPRGQYPMSASIKRLIGDGVVIG